MIRQDTPKVSVCLPSYNHARFLPAAIESILNQTYQNFEVIIVDDGSTDGSLEIAKAYAANHPSRIQVFTHPNSQNLGISSTVNLAYEKSSGEYWCGLPSDDMLLPHKLERQVAFLEGNPHIGWVYAYAKPVDEAGHALTELKLFGGDITGDNHPVRRLLQKNWVFGTTVLMRRSCTEKVGLHATSLLYSDWEFWLRMIAQCRAAFLPYPLAHYRVHDYNTSINIPPQETMRRSLEVMLSFRPKAERLGTAKVDARTLALIDLQTSFYCFCLSQEVDAALHLQSAFHTDPTLAQDERFFTRWLREKIFELTYTFAPFSPERGFASWVRKNLPPTAEKTLSHRAAAAEMAQASLDARTTDLKASGRLSLSCIKKDPSWLLDGSLRYALLESFLGQRVMEKMRQWSLSLKRVADKLAD